MKSVALVFGTRPEAIKMCPLIKELKKRGTFRVVTIVSGQHRELLHGVLEAFHVIPDYDLALMREGQSQAVLVSGILDALSRVLEREMPNVVLVHGDTATTLAASLCCFYLGIPVGHVEAGLRTYDMRAPFPEEFNRQTAGLIAAYHFAPTSAAAKNLLREGKEQDRVFVTGNTGIDALRYTVRTDFSSPLLNWAKDGKLVLLTTHRRESVGLPMRQMLDAIKRGVRERKDARLAVPVHPNPTVRKVVEEIFFNCPRVRICEPFGVVEFHNIMARAHMILTDSGGIQEEASALCVPTLVLRDKTERPEGVEAGVLHLVGVRPDNVYKGFCDLYDAAFCRPSLKTTHNPYGDGYASARIADILEREL